MPSPVANSIALLNAGLRATGGEEVTYRRSNAAIEQLAAVPCRGQLDDYGDGPVAASAKQRDWLIWKTELVYRGELWEPTRGDKIDWIDELGTKHTYEVLPRAGDRVFKPTDTSEQLLRVYTQETKAHRNA